MKRRALLLAAAAVAAILTGPAAASAPAEQRQTLVLVRTTDGPASYNLVVDSALSDASPRGFNGTISGRVEKGRLVRAASLGATAFYWDHGVTARANGQTLRVCDAAGGCIVNRTLAYQVQSTARDAGGPDVDNRLYVVIEGPATIRFKGDGWKLVRTPLTYRYVEAAKAQASGVFTGLHSAQTFESATLPGGRRGSVAAGAPPCSFSTPGVGPSTVPRGAGTITLTGGPKPESLTCPENVGRPFVTSVAQKETSWLLEGPVVGDSTGVNVPLFVLDVPAEPLAR